MQWILALGLLFLKDRVRFIKYADKDNTKQGNFLICIVVIQSE